MKKTLLLFTTAVLLCQTRAIAQPVYGKIMNEDRVRELVKDHLALGQLEFVERKDDDSLTVYEYFLLHEDTLHKVLVNGRAGTVDTIIVELQNGRAQLQARQLAYTRAETAALAAVAGEVMRWKLKKSEGKWFYKFRIETAKGKFKDVFVDKESFEVARVRNYE